MKLGIISDCIHYKMPDGKIGTENHILLRQLQELCSHFSETLISCPFGEYNAARVISTYTDTNIQFYALPKAGGGTIKAKIELLLIIPKWLKAYRTIDKFSDIVYQRFPNNLNIPGFFYFWLKKKKVFATYTGTWKRHRGEPITYMFQRWLLNHCFKGPVWVYADEKPANTRIIPSYSPSYSDEVWNEEIEEVEKRIAKLKTNGLTTFRLITVGSLCENKNQVYIIEACKLLKEIGFDFTLKIVGDGEIRNHLSSLINQYSLQNEIEMVGKKRYEELRELYRQSDFVVQAPLTEGFGKVPVEGLFHGVIPIINNISLAFVITGNGERGFLFEANKPENLVNCLLNIKQEIHGLPHMIKKGREYAKSKTLKAWANEYYDGISEYYK